MTVVPSTTAPDPATGIDVKPGLYRHFKGGQYLVLSIAVNSETDEPLVVYRSADDSDRLWARPLIMFSETIDQGGVVTPRFQRIADLPSDVLVASILGQQNRSWAAPVQRLVNVFAARLSRLRNDPPAAADEDDPGGGKGLPLHPA